MANLYRGDDTAAFGGNFLKVNLIGSVDSIITKAEWGCGSVVKVFEDPEFPLTINLTSEETAQLKSQNTCYLVLYDENGLRKTCEGSLTFSAMARRV
ncbi:MAG: hypothetical protein NC124_02055 [Clostridium sp.]|nr:hypothetical protein [Clostridium sp.]